METYHRIDELRVRLAEWRRTGEPIAFVPTMGNLHAGHLELIRQARRRAARVVASIFVNPLQFGPREDFSSYPRTLEADRQGLEETGADVLFAPSGEEMYPQGQEGQTRVEVPGLSDILCGASRPGHFIGVATVVCKLFNAVQPNVAVFGEKDFQQLLVIRRMTVDLNLPIEIIGIPTVRHPDGLAMSSRNGYLNPEERTRAPCLYQTLQTAAREVRAEMAPAEVAASARDQLERNGLRPDYVSIRRATDLAEPSSHDRALVILAAAYLGQTRLIDNLRVEW